MTHAALMARADAITEALRVTDSAIGDEQPTDQALRIIAAIKRLQDGKPARITGPDRRDYFAEAQAAARAEWEIKAAFRDIPPDEQLGPEFDGIGRVHTPLGLLVATVWRVRWKGTQINRVCWAGTYTLKGEPISVAEMRDAGLAKRQTTRKGRNP